MLQILSIIAPLFLIIFVISFLENKEALGKNWSHVLNDYALKIGLPVLIFCSLCKTRFSFSTESGLIIFNSIFIVSSFVGMLLIGKFFRIEKQNFRTLFICFLFGNIAYLGIPILTAVSGDAVLKEASLIIGIYLFLIFTLGVGYLDYSDEQKKEHFIKEVVLNLFKNPLLIAGVLGILVGSLQINLPTVLLKSLEMISVSVTPTVLIVIGLFIGKSKIGNIKEWVPIFFFSLLRLMIVPGIFFLGIKAFGFIPKDFSSSIIQAAMPLAITPFALADKYNLNKNFIARSIVLSTILSIITLPFWISIL